MSALAKVTHRRLEELKLPPALGRDSSEMRAIVNAISAAHSSLSLNTTVPRILDAISATTGVAACFLCLLDNTGTSLVPAFRRGASLNPLTGIFWSMPWELGRNRFAMELVEGGLPSAILDVDHDPRVSEEIRGINKSFDNKSCLGLPLTSNGKVFGAIFNVTFGTYRSFSQEEVQLCVAVAGLAALAIEHARLLEESRSRSRQFRALRSIKPGIGYESDTAESHRAVVGAATGLGGAGADEIEYPLGPLSLLAPKTRPTRAPVQRDSAGAIRVKSEFLSLLAHDLSSPIGLIRAYVASLTRNDLTLTPEQRSSLLSRLGEVTSQLSSLTQDIVDMDRMECGQFALNKCTYDLATDVARLVEQFRTRSSVCCDFCAETTGPMVIHADPMQIRRVVGNLLENAAKHAGSCDISVRASRRDRKWAVIEVEDRGQGISPTDLNHIFEKSYRGEGTTGRDGSGLGLYICQQIILAHKGEIWVHSKPGAGTSFGFTIPLGGA